MPFTDFITEINNTQVDNAKDLRVIMPMQNLVEYNNSYSKISGGLYQFCRDEANNVATESESLNHLNLNQNSQKILIMKVL